MIKQIVTAAVALLLPVAALAVPELQITSNPTGACGSYDFGDDDCLVGDSFYVTSQPVNGLAYIVFSTTPQQNNPTNFTIAPTGDGGALTEVESGFGSPPLADALPGHGIFDTYYKVYEVDFNGPQTTIFNSEPPNGADSTLGYIEAITMNLTFLAPGSGLHIDLFRCSSGSYAGGDCTTGGNDIAPFSHDASYVPIPAAAWLFGSGLIALAGIARKRKAA